MLAQVNRLQYWKTEHDEQTCEDALGERLAQGLFAVADGVGTTLFSNVWADLLVEHFLAVPLLSIDPFEVEWWLRQAQELYQERLPLTRGLPWNAVQKAHSEGSYSTLATCRVTAVESNYARATLVAIGDSCVLVKQVASGQILSFPLDNAADFDNPPISLPSKLSAFHRHFQRCVQTEVDLQPGDIVILATDAVSRWILSAGNEHYASIAEAFELLADQTAASWSTFVAGCRARGEMVDDDSTAIVLTLSSDDQEAGMSLGYTAAHRKDVRALRHHTLNQALHEQNKELLAITYGDGSDLRMEGISLPDEQVRQAREVADAQREVLSVLRREVNNPEAVHKLTPVWQKYGPLLQHEPCAASLRKTLQRLGVSFELQPERESSSEIQPVEVLSPSEPLSIDHAPNVSPVAETTPPIQSQVRPTTVALKSVGHEQLELERRLLEALRTGDDPVILSVYQDVCASPYAQDVVLSPQSVQQIQAVQQRETERQRLQRALASQSASQIASVYASLVHTVALLSDEERQLLERVSSFRQAYNMDEDEVLLRTYDEIQQLLPGQIIFTAQEEARVARARLHIHAHIQTPQAPAQTEQPERANNMYLVDLPVISAEWFQKMCAVNRAYRRHCLLPDVEPEQLEIMTMDELINAPLIQAGLEEISRISTIPLILPETLLAHTFKAFKNDHKVAYRELVQQHNLTSSDVQSILLMFFRQQLFVEYLLWQEATSLNAWLQQHEQERVMIQRELLIACPWIAKLRWWKE